MEQSLTEVGTSPPHNSVILHDPVAMKTTTTSGIWSNKDPKDTHILDLVGVAQKIANDSNNPSKNKIGGSTKVEPAYIRYLTPWMIK